MPPDTLTKWSISPAYDALSRNLELPLPASEAAAIPWQEVEAEPPGFVVLYRYREAPHPRVTFQSDFSTRLQPRPGRSELPGPGLPRDRQPGERRGLHNAEEGEQRADAGRQRARRRLGLRLPRHRRAALSPRGR